MSSSSRNDSATVRSNSPEVTIGVYGVEHPSCDDSFELKNNSGRRSSQAVGYLPYFPVMACELSAAGGGVITWGDDS